MIMGNYLRAEAVGVAEMSDREPMGVRHLTVVPENFDVDSAEGTDGSGERTGARKLRPPHRGAD